MSSPIQARHVEVTKEAILRALMDLIHREGVAGFSVQRVADAAGVAHRTVYRYFPSREALLEGLGTWINEGFAKALRRGPDDPFPKVAPDELGRVAETGYRFFSENAELTATYVILAVGARIRLPSRVRRTRWFEERLAGRARHLAPQDAKAAAVLIRTLASATSWHHMTEHSDAEPRALARAVRWAIDVLLRDLDAGGGPRREGDRDEG